MTVSCPSGQAEYKGRCCDRCLKGKYVSVDCSTSSPTKCETCPHETYTAQNNYFHKCIACTQCNSDQRVVQNCEAHSDRTCECKDGLYCKSYESNGHCHLCKQVTDCPPGTGVSAKPTSSKDTICRPCTSGTYSSVTDYKSSCFNHTDCKALGRHLKTLGTDKTDTVCGDFVQNDHFCWKLPAGLWAGLILTIIISLIVVLFYRRVKRKSQQTVSISVCSQNYSPPVLPPDIIKHPNSPELQTLFNKDEMFSIKDECCLECDGVTMTTITASEKYGPVVRCDHCGDLTSTEQSFFQSEPQEDEWPGA